MSYNNTHRVANSTPIVLLLSKLNSFLVKRDRRLLFPTPESPINTTSKKTHIINLLKFHTDKQCMFTYACMQQTAISNTCAQLSLYVLSSINIIIRPHISTTYVDAAFSYRLHSVVCWSVSRSVTLVRPAKTAELIEMLFGLRTPVGPGNYA